MEIWVCKHYIEINFSTNFWDCKTLTTKIFGVQLHNLHTQFCMTTLIEHSRAQLRECSFMLNMSLFSQSYKFIP